MNGMPGKQGLLTGLEALPDVMPAVLYFPLLLLISRMWSMMTSMPTNKGNTGWLKSLTSRLNSQVLTIGFLYHRYRTRMGREGPVMQEPEKVGSGVHNDHLPKMVWF